MDEPQSVQEIVGLGRLASPVNGAHPPDEKWQFEKEWRVFAGDCSGINISRYLKLKPSFLVAGKNMEAGAFKRLESIANAFQIPFRNETNNLV